MREIALLVNGRKYLGWKDIRVTISLEALSRSFSMSVSERWQADQRPWPIIEGDECQVLFGDEPVVTGYVDRRQMSLSAADHPFTVSGSSRAADLLDCSAVLEAWEFAGVGVLEIAQRVAQPFGVTVSYAPGVTPAPVRQKVVINPGETAYEVIDRACRLAGLFAISDAQGDVLLTVAGAAMAATPLVEGMNILQAAARYDASACYRQYIVIGQQQGTDLLSGEAAADVRAIAMDMNVRRAARVLMTRAEGSVTIQQAQDRASWEAAVRRARGVEIGVTVQGWEQSNGQLWPVNSKVMFQAPFLGEQREMLISEVTFSLSEGGGTTTELTLRPADSFRPEPVIPKADDASALEDFE